MCTDYDPVRPTYLKERKKSVESFHASLGAIALPENLAVKEPVNVGVKETWVSLGIERRYEQTAKSGRFDNINFTVSPVSALDYGQRGDALTPGLQPHIPTTFWRLLHLKEKPEL